MKQFIVSILLLFSGACLYSQGIQGYVPRMDQLHIESYDELYSKLYFEEMAGSSEEIGKPALPYVIKAYLIPPGVAVGSVHISLARQTATQGTHLVYPAQPDIPIDESAEAAAYVAADPEVYQSRQMFPEVPYEIMEEEIFGYRICKVRFYPFSYVPAERKLYRNEFQVQIPPSSLRAAQAVSKIAKSSAFRQQIARDYVLSMVENPSDLQISYGADSSQVSLRAQAASTVIPVTNPHFMPDYLIITSEALKAEFKKLADWKSKKGFRTYIKTVEEIYASYPGTDRQEKIRSYIIESVNKWGPALFVLLGGDVNIVPAREHLTEDSGAGKVFYAADSYYANTNPANTWNANFDHLFGDSMDGASVVKDIVLGRIPADSPAQVTILVNKLLEYEKANLNIDYSYLNNTLMAAAPIRLGSTPAGDNNGAISGLITLHDTYLKTRMTNRFLIDQRYTSYSGNSVACQKINGLYSHFTRNSFLDALNATTFKPHIIYHMDHSGSQSMGTSNKTENQYINLRDVDALQNGKYYHILMSGGCNPGDFSKDCIGEHFLFKAQGGAVAFLGNTDVGWASEGWMFTNFIKGIFSHATNRIGLGFNSIFTNPRWNMHLLGDPEMPVWTSTPKKMTVTSSIQRQLDGSYLLTVTTANMASGATLCISKENDLYHVSTIRNGNTVFSLSPSFSGTLSVTATAPGYIPVLKEMNVLGVPRQTVVMNQVTIDDASGNRNGMVDAGETVSLKLKVKSNYSLSIAGLKATVTCNNPSVRLHSNQVTWGTIASNSTKEASLTFTVDKDAKECLQSAPDAVTFRFTTTDDNGNSYYLEDVKVDLYEPDLQIQLTEMTTLPEAGKILMLRFRIMNTHLGEATSIQASLGGSYTSTRSKDLGTLKSGKDSVHVFALTVLNTYPGGNLPVTMTLTNKFGKKWAKTINVTNIPAAIPVANCDYSCDASWIQVYWPHRTGVSGYNVYRADVNLSTGTPSNTYRKQNKDLLKFAYYTDDGVNELTSYAYKVSVVSADGVEGPLSDPIIASTSYKKTGLFPIDPYLVDIVGRSGGRIDAPLIVDDISGDKNREIFTAVQNYSGWGAALAFNSNGDDLFDIDNNVTTHSGFADTDKEICAATAIAPLRKGGKKHFFFTERGEGTLSNTYSYSFRDDDGDGKPDLVWQKRWGLSSMSAVIVANVDGSSDGSNEVIIRGEGNSSSGNRKIGILSNQGEQLYTFGDGSTYAGLAVADLTGNGEKEVIAGFTDGKVQVYKYNGTLIRTLLNVTGVQFNSTPIVCDLDNDGKKEILILGKKSGRSYLYVRRADGTTVAGWNDTQNVLCSNTALDHPLSVGDLNNNGKLEVVVTEKDNIRIYNNTGTLLKTIPVPGLTPQTALLADVDGDGKADILVTVLTQVIAYNLEGKRLTGFPLRTSDQILSVPAVADIDNDGKNEVIVAGRRSLCVWKTEGKADAIQWGMAHHNPQNTGEYKCPPQTIRANTTWNTIYTIKGDLVVNTGTLTLNSAGTIRLKDESTLVVQRGATLRINGGTIENADIEVLDGGKLEILNNGKIQLRKGGFFIVENEATLNYTSGEIVRP